MGSYDLLVMLFKKGNSNRVTNVSMPNLITMELGIRKSLNRVDYYSENKSGESLTVGFCRMISPSRMDRPQKCDWLNGLGSHAGNVFDYLS